MESFVRNIAEGKMSPDNYYGYTGYNLYFFVRYYQAIRHCNVSPRERGPVCRTGRDRPPHDESRGPFHACLLPLPAAASLRSDTHCRDQPHGRPDCHGTGSQYAHGRCVNWINKEIDWVCENGMPAARDEKFTLGLPHHRRSPCNPVAHGADGRQPVVQRQYGLQELEE